MPTFSAVPSATIDRPGTLQPGVATAIPVTALPAVPTTALPYIAHVYDNSGLSFKQTLAVLNHPPLQATLNAGYQSLALSIGSSQPSNLYGTRLYGDGGLYGEGIGFGDLVRITEQGGDGLILYTGIVEEMPDSLEQASGNTFQLVLTPLVASLGDTYFNQAFDGVDVAVMARAAVAATQRLSSSPRTIADTGVIRSYAFNNTTALDVLTVCRQLAGVNWAWHVDAIGQVWFYQVITSGRPTYTVSANQYQARKRNPVFKYLKNRILVLGGIPAGGSAPISAIYNSTASQAQFGLRNWDPPPVYPTVTNQSDLQAIADTLGAAFDRVQNVVEVTLPNYPQRIALAQPGGATLRLLEPSANSLVEAEVGTGIYSQNFVVSEVTTDGASQKLVCGDVATGSLNDYSATIDRILQRTSLNSLVYTPASLNVAGILAPTGSLATAASGARTVINQSGIHVYDAAGRRVIDEDPGLQRITVFDDNGIARAEMGRVDANGISPAQSGFRASAADGTPIFDSLGLIGVAAVAATVTSTGVIASMGPFGSVADRAVTGATTPSFTLARPTWCFAISAMSGSTADTAGFLTQAANVFVQISGQAASARLVIPCYPSTDAFQNFGSATPYVIQRVAAGTYTASLFWNNLVTTQTLTYNDRSVTVYLLGG